MVLKKEQLESDQKEYQKVSKMLEKKDAKNLGRWLEKFSRKGDFWLSPKYTRRNKNDWL